jgi:hypothetical protein
LTMSKARGDSETQELELIDEWPVDLPGTFEGVMVAVDEGKALVALELPNQREDGCFVFDIESRSYHPEKWFQPDWVKQQWKVWNRGPEKGIRDLSVARNGTRTIAAVATKAGYAACWELGSDTGCTIEAQHEIQTVAVHPNSNWLAIGTGRKVLDTVSQAIAEVQLWTTDGKEMLDKRRLPGACVIRMLWVHNQDGLMPGLKLRAVDGKSLGIERPCILLENDWIDTVLVVTTESRNQRGGFVTILDPQLFTILDIAEIPEPDEFLTPLCAWPESRQIWAGQLRQLDDLYESFGRAGVDLQSAPQITAWSAFGGIWLNNDRMFRFAFNGCHRLTAQLWKRPI